MPERNRETAEREDETERGDPEAPHAFWSGTITFGLVSVPVELAPDGTPLAREYYCPAHESPVPSEDLARGHRVEGAGFVTVDDEELEALDPGKTRDISLLRFVHRREIPLFAFERGYHLVPAGESTKAYRLLAETMERLDQAGIATFVMRGREHPVAIFAEDGLLRAETLRFADEVRTPETVGLPEPEEVPRAEVKRFAKLIASLGGETEQSRARPGRNELLRELAEAKYERGEDVVETGSTIEGDEGPEREGAELMELLKRRLAARGEESGGDQRDGERSETMPDAWSAKRERQYEHIKESAQKRGASTARAKEIAARTVNDQRRKAGETKSGRKTTSGTGNPQTRLEDRTKQQLYNRAAELGIEGRSKLDKEGLVRAIRSAT